jgi:AcrR family transcriptional regulator
VLEHGLGEMSLRPLAAAVNSSPRVLLYLFGSKDGLVRALLARARTDELRLLDDLKSATADDARPSLQMVAEQVWAWLATPRHRALLLLWIEAYARSLVEPDGPWTGFARDTVHDWLDVLAQAQSPDRRDTVPGKAERTAVLAILRGALLDLLATGDHRRTSAAIHHAVSTPRPST